MLDEQKLRRAMPPGLGLIYHAEAGSTNAIAKELAGGGAPEGLVVAAGRQTAGRGRLGRSFLSPEGGIYFSLIMRPAEDCWPALTMAACVGACRAIRGALGITPGIKWVNDLYHNGRKICGILAEGAAGPGGLSYAVVGLGLNYCSPPFEGELADKAGSLYPSGEPPVAAEAMAARLMEEVYSALKEPLAHGIYMEYRAASLALGREVLIAGRDERAEAVDISPTGALLVRHGDGRMEALNSGEVSILI